MKGAWPMAYWETADHSWTPDSSRFFNTPSQKNRDLFYVYQEMGHFKALKPYYTERSGLSSYLIKFTLSGKGSLTYQERTEQITPGDVFFIDCRNYQYYKTVSEEPWEMDWIHISGGQTKAFYEEFVRTGTSVFHTQGDPWQNPLHMIMTKLLYLQDKQTTKTDFESSVLIHELLNELLIQKYQLNFQDQDIPAYILEMKDYIIDHLQEPITLELLEHKFHLNRYQLNKEFSRYIGMPPIEYQIHQRISKAKDLLRYSDLSIQEVATNVGLENFSYFSRLFKKKTGLAPSTFRKIG